MGWRITSLLAGATLTGATGCVAPYGAALSCRAGADGYCQRELAPGRYALTYAGTPEDPAQPLAALWLTRAAQLCHGRPYATQFVHGPAFDVRYQHPALTGVAPDMALADAGPAVYGEVSCADAPLAVAGLAAPAAVPGHVPAAGARAEPAPGVPQAALRATAAADASSPQAFALASAGVVTEAQPGVVPAPDRPGSATPGAFVARVETATAAFDAPAEPIVTPARLDLPPIRSAVAADLGDPWGQVADSAALPPSARGYVFGPLPGELAPDVSAPPVQATAAASFVATPDAPAASDAVTAQAMAPSLPAAPAGPAMRATTTKIAKPADPGPFVQAASAAKPASTPATSDGTPGAFADAPVASPRQVPTAAPAAPARPAHAAPAPVIPAPALLAAAAPTRTRVPDAANLPPSARGYVFGALDAGALVPVRAPAPAALAAPVAPVAPGAPGAPDAFRPI